MFFDRVGYKERGKEIVKMNFWILVLACFVANLLGGQSSFNSGGFNFYFSTNGTSTNDNNGFNFDFLINETDTNNGESLSSDLPININNILVKFIPENILAKVDGVSDIILFLVIILLVVTVISIVYYIFVGNIMQVGKKKLFLENVDCPNGDFALIFSGFTGGKYMKRVAAMFIYQLIVFLWSLLFVIPGIIAAYKYYLVPYIIADNPDISITRAMQLSKEMTYGHKFEIFVMELSFLGWALLGVCCTCGILGYWLNPYMESSFAVMYTEMRNHAITNGEATAEEFCMPQTSRQENNNDYNYFN